MAIKVTAITNDIPKRITKASISLVGAKTGPIIPAENQATEMLPKISDILFFWILDRRKRFTLLV